MRKGRDGENGKKYAITSCRLKMTNCNVDAHANYCFIPDFARPTVCMQCVVYSEAVLSRLP